jgi:hypothetical protein
MAKSNITDEQFIALEKELQSPAAVAKVLGVSVNAERERRRRIEKVYGIILPVNDHRKKYNTILVENRSVAKYEIQDGIVVIGSDVHVWPGPLTTMQRGFIHMIKQLKPAAVVLNGDVCDFARISRFGTIGWENRPSVREELDAVAAFLLQVEKAAKGARRFWPLGNHDLRFESKIANSIPEMAKVDGVHLKDHFPEWIPCWRLDINSDVIVRHRELGGEHADFRNVQTAGLTVVTGHDHRANVTPYTSYRGTHWGVRTGYMAESQTDPQFVHYLEAREPNWQPAFAVLTFIKGKLMWPELVVKHSDNEVAFRGSVIKV